MTDDNARTILEAALRFVPDPIERASVVFQISRLFDEIARLRNENADLRQRIDNARASLADMREELEQQMEFWRPKDEP